MWDRNMMFGLGGWPFSSITMSLFLLVIVFDLVLRGVSLWKSARAGQKGWFIVLIIFNTVGILPVLYLVFFQKKNKKK